MIRALSLLAALTLAAFPARAATDIEVVETPGGITAWLVQEPSIPMVALQISFLGGTSLDPVGKEGVTNMMMGLLEDGAGDLDQSEFAEEEDRLAARISFRANRDSVSIDAEMLTENLDEAVELLRLAIAEPRFDSGPIERIRAQILVSHEGATADPNDIASAAFREMSFPGHPYSIRSDGTPDAVQQISRDDLIDAHRSAMVRSRILVGAVGDITPEKLGEILDHLFRDLPEEGPELPDPIQMAADGGTTVIDLDVPQSVALFGHSGILRDDPDFIPAFVVMEILGGTGIDSRLRTEIREKRGLSYGISAYLAPFNHAGQILGRFASSNQTMGEAVDLVRSEWGRIAADGITEAELDAAKLFLTGAYPLRFDGNVRIAGSLVGLQISGLTPDYVKTRNDQIMALTLEEVNRVAKRLFDPEALRFVVVGQPEGLVATD